jgi:predicted lipoprotein with Yx(FWY)xxD motif
MALALTAALLVLGACTSEGGSDTTAAGGDATTVAGGDGTTVAGGDGAGVSVATTDLGDVLVDPDGFTMYVFTNDTDGESTCYDDCAALWPPVPGDTAIGSGLDAGMFSTVDRTDGTTQLTVNGQPLYRYTPDTAAGQTTGQGVGGVWFVVGADGAMIEG